MATYLYSGTVEAHASEVVTVTASETTKSGAVRTTEISLTKAAVDELRKTFEFQSKYCPHLGHAWWHVHNGVEGPCESCKS